MDPNNATFSPHTSTYLYSGDASPLSSNQSLSSNSRHSDSYDEVEGGGSAPDVNSAAYVPRGPLINYSASPVTLRPRKTQSLYNPNMYQLSKIVSSPSMQDRADVISLQEFLEEANKTPNRVRNTTCMCTSTCTCTCGWSFKKTQLTLQPLPLLACS